MTKEEWENLSAGMVIYSKKGTMRKILKISEHKGKTDCITLEALKMTRYGEKTTVYCKNDRINWSLWKLI